MAQLNKVDFSNDLQKQLKAQVQLASSLKELELDVLNKKEAPKKWSVLECFDHMILSTMVYTDQLDKLSLDPGLEVYVKIGWKGNFFAEGMRPKDEVISYKMKTFKRLNPKSNLSLNTIDEFIMLCNKLSSFITDHQNNRWANVKVVSALGPILKLNLSEALNFVIAHNERHLLQAKHAIHANMDVSSLSK
ncbi:MAG TPA: DinB family protein [Fulvivirga sp.]|nr:DinB family protein [Fulvivirga sp.]